MADEDDEDEDEDEDDDDAPSIAPFASRFVDPSVRPSSSEVTKVKLHAERLASLHCVTLRSHRCRKRGDDEEARDGNGKKMKVRGATSSSSRTLDVRARAHRVALLDATLKRETNLSKEWMEARDDE
jgi:hypothetical protein